MNMVVRAYPEELLPKNEIKVIENKTVPQPQVIIIDRRLELIALVCVVAIVVSALAIAYFYSKK